MKAHDNGSFFSCSVSRNDVDAFNDSWPCSVIPSRSVWFQFDKRNGDLVDIRGLDGIDGAEVLALSRDAQNYAAKKLSLPETCFRR